MRINKSIKFSNNKSLIASIVGANLTLLLLVISFVPRGAHGEFDFPALWQQVQDQQKQIDNHEARITNTEKDVTATQANTNTPAAADHVAVPASATPTPAPSPTNDTPVSTPPNPTWIYLGLPQVIQGDEDNCLQQRQWSDGHIDSITIVRKSNQIDRCPQ